VRICSGCIELHSPAILFSPLDVIVPLHGTGLALIPPQLYAPSDILGDRSIPPSLVYSTIDRFLSVPTLLGYDIGQVASAESLARVNARQVRVG